VRTALEQTKLEHHLKTLIEESVSFHEVLGLKILSLHPETVSTRFAMKANLVGHFHSGRLHGGVISAVLDGTAGLGLMVAYGEKYKSETADQILHRFVKMGTIDMRVDFLRPGVGEYFDTTVKVTRLGGRIASTQMALTNNLGELIATGAASYVVS
jgi:uncharacterized protein (TIGR00369 family)